MATDKTVPLAKLNKNKGETTVETQHYGIGRVLRTMLGVLIILIDVASFFVTHVLFPILTKTAPDWSLGVITGHLVFLVMGFMMFDPETGKALVDHVLAKLPGGR